MYFEYVPSLILGNSHGVETIIMCYVDRLLELIGSQCKFCSLQSKVSARAVGCSLVVKMVCSRGHTFSWASSPVVTNSNKSVLYKANLIFASTVLLSGNNYHKCCSFAVLWIWNVFHRVHTMHIRDFALLQQFRSSTTKKWLVFYPIKYFAQYSAI